MWKLGLCFLFVAVTAAPERRALNSLDAFNLQSFVKLFREIILETVAADTKQVVADIKVLNAQTVTCNVKINTSSDQCQTCAKSACQTSPTWKDYLNLANPYTYLKGPLNDLGNSMGKIVDVLGDGSKSFVHSMESLGKSTGDVFKDGFDGFTHGLETGVHKIADLGASIGTGVVDTVNTIGGGITDAGHAIKDGVNSAVHAVEHVGSSIGHAIGSIFGRKRAIQVDAQTRQCMEQCAACRPLLQDDQTMIRRVCGDSFVNLNNTVRSKLAQVTALKNAVIDTTNPIISKIEFDPASMNGMQFTTVFVTANIKGSTVRYQSSVPYQMMNVPATVRGVAAEYLRKLQ